MSESGFRKKCALWRMVWFGALSKFCLHFGTYMWLYKLWCTVKGRRVDQCPVHSFTMRRNTHTMWNGTACAVTNGMVHYACISEFWEKILMPPFGKWGLESSQTVTIRLESSDCFVFPHSWTQNKRPTAHICLFLIMLHGTWNHTSRFRRLATLTPTLLKGLGKHGRVITSFKIENDALKLGHCLCCNFPVFWNPSSFSCHLLSLSLWTLVGVSVAPVRKQTSHTYRGPRNCLYAF
jgi:hypothetical protein